MTDPEEIRSRLEHQVDLVIDGGFCGHEATTVLDLQGGTPELVRLGAGKWEDEQPPSAIIAPVFIVTRRSGKLNVRSE